MAIGLLERPEVVGALANSEITYGNNDQGVHKSFYPAGELLYRQGGEANELMLLGSGQAKLEEQKNQRNFVHSLLQAPSILAEGALLGTLHRQTAKAMTDCHVLSIEKGVLNEVLTTDPELSIKFATLLASRIRRQRSHIEDLVLHSLMGRIAEAMLMFSEDKLHPGPLEAYYADVADYVVGSKRRVARTIRTLSRQEAILVNGFVEIKQPDRLARLPYDIP